MSDEMSAMAKCRRWVVDEATSCRFSNCAVIAALLVVLLHSANPTLVGSSGWWFREITHGFAKASVPFFFICSGFFLAGHVGEVQWWTSEVRKRIRSLLLPFWLWGGIYWLYLCLMILVSCFLLARQPFSIFYPGQFELSKLVGWLGINPLSPPLYSVTWYLRSLFLFVVLAPVLHKMMALCKWSVLLLWLFDSWGLHLFNLDVVVFSGLTWFCVGMGLRQGFFSLNVMHRRRAVTLLWGALLVAIGVKSYWDCLGYCRWFSMYGVTIPITMSLMWLMMPAVRFPRFLVDSTMAVYLLHSFLISIFIIAVRPSEESAIMCATKAVFAYVGSLGVYQLMRKLLPRKLNALLFGGR